MKDTLIVLQCCKSKKGKERFPKENTSLQQKLPKTYHILQDGIEKYTQQKIIDASTAQITALSLYTGWFYRHPQIKPTIANEAKHGATDFLIISAGYGLVHPFQRIHNYEQRMQGPTTRYWINAGLSQALTEYTHQGGYRRVYGFFSRTSDYQKIFTNISWHQLENITEAGFFTLSDIQGTSQILQNLAQLLLDLLSTHFTNRPTQLADATVLFTKMK